MALITPDRLEKVFKERNTVHKPTNAAFTTFTVKGKKYFQIDTFGSDERAMPDKVSQSIQLSEEAVKVLYDLLKREFDF